MAKVIYEISKNSCDMEVIKKTEEDGKIYWIPSDPANSDYQNYLASLEAPKK